jgi:hypothetical protein
MAGGRVLSALLVVAACCFPPPLRAQFTDPRNYTVAPVVTNELELDYSYAHASDSIDTSLAVVGAHLVVNQAALSFTHNFSALGHIAWAKVSVPFASVRGSVDGTDLASSTTGSGDSSLEIGALLNGGKALSAAEFAAYEPATTLGVSLTISAPTGEYDPQKLVNLGADRWSFKPELGLSYPFGPERRWAVDAYINAYFFTDNTEYHGVEILRQQPLPGIEGHLSYTFTPSVWASADLRYSFRGETAVDGVAQNNAQKNLTAGAEANWSPNPQNSLDLVFGTAVVHRNAPASTSITLKYIYSWGSGVR